MSSTEDFPRTVEQARTDIELTRQELGATAQALAHKLNVTERAKERFQQRSASAKGSLRERGEVAVRLVREKPIPVAVWAALVALSTGGLVTGRVRR
jgi:hypothetical protein